MRLDLGPSLAAAKAEAQVRVDADAEAARLRFITPGAGQALEYQVTEAEARAYVAASTPVAADYPFLAAEAQAIEAATGSAPPLSAIAAEIIALADGWAVVGSAIKALRRTAKLKIEAATSHAQIRAAAQVQWPAP